MPNNSDDFTLKILTPNGSVLSKNVVFIRIPGPDGDLGILKDHTPALIELVPGKLLVHFPDDEKERYFVPGGFAQILQESVIILTEYMDKIRDIDITVAEAEALHAQKVLEEKEVVKEIDRKQAMRLLLRARAKMHHFHHFHHLLNK